ncbi:MAG TPA: hybrid sensor histidine kinase/response regulator [Chromatiales bacterium]|nr:hybrid sensor histidine kinase/response regulator [Chromatiales bacterium]
MSDDLSGFSMLELFRTEAEGQLSLLTDGLLVLEHNPAASDNLEPMMRASHSIKGAARMVEIDPVVRIAHVMEDCFVAAQKKQLTLNSSDIDVLLKGVDLMAQVAKLDESALSSWEAENNATVDSLVRAIEGVLSGERQQATVAENSEALALAEKGSADESQLASPVTPSETGGLSADGADNSAARTEATLLAEDNPPPDKAPSLAEVKERVLRVSTERMDRLLGLAGEAMVEARWLHPHIESMQRFKRFQFDLVSELDSLRERFNEICEDPALEATLIELQRKAVKQREILSDRLVDLEHFDYRAANLAGRLHREVLASRMRPFSDGVDGFQRMVRDVARSLGKDARLEITGVTTQVDRDVLEMVKAPLNHLLRNAVDHGIEMPEVRIENGKPAQAIVKLDACHRSGMLLVTVEDDGRGVDLESLKQKIIERGLSSEEMLSQMSEMELLEFLFLPSFSTRNEVTELSGRGVGLDVVHDSVKEMRGVVTIASTAGEGTRFQMQLPLTLSVIRTLLVDIGGESYAFPLARIDHLLKISAEQIELVEDHQYITWNDNHIGLVSAAQLFGVEQGSTEDRQLSVVILSDRHGQYGVIVDAFLGERELAVQVIDPRLGKVKDISVAALLDDGSPTLIIDVDDMARSIAKLISRGQIDKVGGDSGDDGERKRVLVVDDSITVREVERKMLEAYGYEVDVAVDGMDGWNAVRSGDYRLVITDIDMPRMDGIELVRLIKQDETLKGLPVMVVSYKDREEDKLLGLEAGADYYLTKGGFHDETLREAVVDLIGEAG